MLLETRKELSADGLFQIVKEYLGKIKDSREGDIKISLSDSLMSGFAMFSLKDPSLLAFTERAAQNENLEAIYHIDSIPSDTRMREINDEVEPFDLSGVFRALFRVAQRGKVLEKLEFYDGYYLVLGDGTGYFSSNNVHCENCLEKVNTRTKEITYYHQMYCMSIAKPGENAVIPLIPEPIIKQDGTTKNDCERNASKRALERLRREHPHLRIIFVEDGLSSNAPHIRELIRLKMKFLLIAKEGDHKFLFTHVERNRKLGKVSSVKIETNGVIKLYQFINGVPLNSSNRDLRINFLEYWETDKKGKILHFAWVTNITLKEDNVERMVIAGRTRWKIENETFNTLKNQGYHFEHNYGHGAKNLSVVFAFLMMLAFLVDQIQQLACGLFQAVLELKRSKRSLWNIVRCYFTLVAFPNMETLYRAILGNLQFTYEDTS